MEEGVEWNPFKVLLNSRNWHKMLLLVFRFNNKWKTNGFLRESVTLKCFMGPGGEQRRKTDTLMIVGI